MINTNIYLRNINWHFTKKRVGGGENCETLENTNIKPRDRYWSLVLMKTLTRNILQQILFFLKKYANPDTCVFDYQ